MSVRRPSPPVRGAARAAARRPSRRPGTMPAVVADLLILVATFVVVSALAGLLGAANLGTALTFGTIAFAAALVGLLLLRD
jgi:ABC-type methionine transport system permease subunit